MDNLPNDILRHIFAFFDCPTRRNARLVCQKWHKYLLCPGRTLIVPDFVKDFEFACWAFRTGYSLNPYVLYYAGLDGYYTVMRWLVEFAKQPVGSDVICAMILRKRNISEIKWMMDRLEKADDSISYHAARHGYDEVLEYVIEKGLPISRYVSALLASNSNVKMLEMLYQRKIPINFDMCRSQGNRHARSWVVRRAPK